MHVSLCGGRGRFGIAGGMNLDYTYHLISLDWVLGVHMKKTNVLDCSGAHGEDSDQSVHVPGLF